MPSEKQLKYLVDMRQAAADIALHLGDSSREEFFQNKTKVRAVEREFEILGEAAKRIDPQTRAELREVEFTHATRMRNILAHDYANVNLDVLWETAHQDVPKLRAALENYLQRQRAIERESPELEL